MIKSWPIRATIVALSRVIGSAMAASVALAAPTSASPDKVKTVHVHGTQTVVDEAAGTSKMHGGLVGDWAVTSFVPIYISSAQIVGSGTETFSGCIDFNHNARCGRHDPTGTLQFTFMY